MDRTTRHPPGYELGFELGSGGMATVFYGRRVGVGGFSHAVAIKQLHRHLASSPDVVSMFLDEARLAARVAHTNVVSILDVVADDGEVWAVMPYVEGESLSRLAKIALDGGQGFPVGIAVAIVVDLLNGLEAAHTATDELGEALGIVHRDVSPQNIIVGTDGVTRVLDFGVAKARGRLHETRDGQVKGKLSYMAPEQLGGEASVSTDVYAAAVVLWELLAGRRLFQGETEIALLGEVLAGAASAPGAHAAVPPALDALVMRALSLDPALRFGSATAMARALLDACAHDVATRAEVTAWVSEVAATSLAERRRMCVDMVRKHGALPNTLGTPAPPPLTIPTERMASSSPGPAIATVVMPQPGSSARPQRRRRLLAAAAVVGALALFVAGASALAPSLPGRTAQAPVANAVSALSGSPPPAEPAAPSLSSAAAPAAARPPVAASAVAVKATRAAAAKPATPNAVPSVPRGPETVAADCDPPFVVDASGVRHYKRSCIR